MRIRVAEIEQDAVPDIARGEAVVILHQADAGLSKACDHVPNVLGIELFGERGGANHIAEHDGELAPLSADGCPQRSGDNTGCDLYRRGTDEGSHRPLRTLAIAQRQSEFGQIGLGEVGHDIEIDPMPEEEIAVVAEANALEPTLQTLLG